MAIDGLGPKNCICKLPTPNVCLSRPLNISLALCNLGSKLSRGVEIVVVRNGMKGGSLRRRNCVICKCFTHSTLLIH